MKSEREILEKLAAVCEVKMSSQKQQEIWDNIEKEMDRMKPIRPKRRSNIWGTSAAAVAAVAIFAGGFYAFSNHGGTGLTTASNDATPVKQYIKYPTRTSIRSISISTGPSAQIWKTQDPKNVENQVLSWLNSSTLYTGNIPSSVKNFVVFANIGQAQFHIVTVNQQDITIYPTYYLAKVNSNAVQVRYVQDVVTYQVENHITNLKSPQLYSWLKNDQWQTEFAPLSIQQASPYSNAQLAKMSSQDLTAYNKQHNQPLRFASGDITRNVPKQPLLVSNPKSGSMFGSQTLQITDNNNTPHSVANFSYPSKNFQVIDQWHGTIQRQSFLLEIDKKTDGGLYIVGVMHGKMSTSYVFNKQPWITNFTGSYVVFASPSPANGNPYYAINLTTGNLLSNAMDLSPYWQTMGGYSGSIEGLPLSYSSLPNNP